MLKLEDIRYPITFHSIGVGSVTFSSPTDGIYTYGRKKGESVSYNVSYYINRHNDHYHKNGDYAYDMPAKPERKIDESGFAIVSQQNADPFSISMSGNFKASEWPYETINRDPNVGLNCRCAILKLDNTCNIEDMPIGAQLLAVNIGERWVDTKIIADTIAINGNEFVLTKKTGEVSSLSVCVKRGIMVKYKI